MRVLMIAVVNLLLTGLILGQQSKFNDVGQDIQLAKPITKQQLLELPPTDKAPRIPLQRALKIAESFIKKQKINLSSSYLFEVKWVRADVNEEPKWRFLWVSISVNGSPVETIKITVSMSGRAKLNSPDL